MKVSIIILLTAYYVMLYGAVFYLLVFLENISQISKEPRLKRFPKVSIIIPVYNGTASVERAIMSCLRLDYPKEKLEIIVVNDGSTDDTRRVCEPYVRTKKIVLINRNVNFGKAAALNLALKKAQGELVACLDDDSSYAPSAFKHLIGYFEDEMVGAVVPNIKARSARGLLQKIQWTEYLFAVSLRKLMTFINALYVVPGAGSVYRKNVLEKLRGFDENNLTEDMDIALRIQKAGYKLAVSVNAKVVTDVPKTFGKLTAQRMRWYEGYLDNIRKHKELLFNKDVGTLGMFLMPFDLFWVAAMTFFVYLMIANYAALIYNALIDVVTLKGGYIGYFLKNLQENSLQAAFYKTDLMLIFFMVFLALGVVVFFIALKNAREKRILLNLRRYALYIFVYFQLIALFWTLSLIQYCSVVFKRRKLKWKGEKVVG